MTPGEGAASEKLKVAPLTDGLVSGRDPGSGDSMFCARSAAACFSFRLALAIHPLIPAPDIQVTR